MILTGRKLRSLAAPLFLVVLAGCGGQPSSGEAGIAQTTLIYFKVECLSDGPNCREVKRYLEAEIPKFKYSFTERSSRQWPYFQAFAQEAKVPIDSLLPPHTRLHRLLPYEETNTFEEVHELVVIELFSRSDSLADYLVNIYEVGLEDRELIGTSGLHPVKITSKDSLSVSEIIRRSVIRYSYK